MMGKKGQLTVVGLIFGVITVVVMMTMMPVIVEFVDLGINETSGVTSTIISFIPAVLVLAVITGILTSAQPRFERVG